MADADRMRAVGLVEYGGPDVLHTVELPEPHAGSGEVRIRVRYAGVNPADVMLRDGSLAAWYADAVPPFIPGMDVAGVIDEVGDSVADVGIGDPVSAIVDNAGSYGGYSEYVAVPAASVIPTPELLPAPAAAGFLMPALTARAALDALALPAGSAVLVSGGAGAVGSAAVVLAHADGLRVTAVAREGDAAFVAALGAQTFIALENSGAVPDVPAADGFVDAAGIAGRLARAVRPGGAIAVLNPPSDDVAALDVRVLPVNVREHVTDRRMIAAVADVVSSGALPVRVAGVFAADHAPAAHAMIERPGLRGRVLLEF